MKEKFINVINVLLEFQENNPNIYIGGSISLILQKVIPVRIPKDIDIISTQRTHICEIFHLDKPQHKLFRRHKYNDILFELFYNPKAQYIEYTIKNKVLKLSPIDEIFKWKINPPYNFNKSDSIKHSKDIKAYNNYLRCK